MGAKFFMCLMLIALVVSPAYCAEWTLRVKTGMEDGKKTPLEESLFGNENGMSIKWISSSVSWCPPGYHECDPSNCPGIPHGWTCCCRN